MAIIQSTIRWADNTADLKKNLMDGVDTLDAMRSSVDRTVASLSGNGLFGAANKVAAAITEMGGATKLTGAEQQRVNVLLDKAIEKYRAMGMQAPAAMLEIRDATKQASEATKDSTSIVSGLAAELAGLFTVGAITAFGRELLQAGDQIQKMADQTGLGTDEVQRFQFIAGQTGSSVDSLVGAVQNLQQRLGDENSGATGALGKLNINLGEFKKLTPYEQMVTAAEGIRQIQDPTEQASVAAAIFGKTWKEILPAIKSGMKEVGDQASVMSDETVKSLDAAGDALDRAHRQVIVWGGTVVTWFEKAGFAVGDYLSAFDPAHFGISNTQLLTMEGILNDPNGLKGALAKLPQLAKELGTQFKQVGLSADDEKRAIANLNEGLKASEKAHKDAAAAAKKHADEIERFRNSVNGLTFKTYIQDLSKLNAVIPDLTKHQAEMASVFDEARDQMDDLVSHDVGINKAFTETGAIIGGTVIPAFSMLPKVIPQATKALDDARVSADSLSVTLSTSLKDALSKIPNMLIKAFEGGGGLMGAIKAIGISISDAIITPLMNKLSAAQKQAIGTGSAMAGALGGVAGGGTGAAIASIAGSLGGAALAASAWGASMTAAGVAGTVALGAATLGIGAAAVGVYLLAKHFLSVSESEKEARAEFQKLQDIYGDLPSTIKAVGAAYEYMGYTGDQAREAIQRALDATHKSAQEEDAALRPIVAVLQAAQEKATAVAGGVSSITAMAKIFGGTVPAQFNDAIQKLAQMKGITDEEKAALMALVNDVKPSFADLTKTADTYGISLAGLGPKFQQADLDRASKQIFDDFTALTGAGADVGGVLDGMSDEIQKLVTDSMQFGTAIPENMRPLIQNLIDAGRLTDDQGNKLTDVAGITFEKTPLSDSLDDLAKAIQALTDLLAGKGGVTDAIAKIGQAADEHIPDNPFADWKIPPIDFPAPPDYGNPYAATGGMVTAAGIQHFSSGGLVGSLISSGTDNVPAMLTPGELILNQVQQGNVAGRLHAAASQSVVNLSEIRAMKTELEGLRADLARSQADLPYTLSRELRAAKSLG